MMMIYLLGDVNIRHSHPTQFEVKQDVLFNWSLSVLKTVNVLRQVLFENVISHAPATLLHLCQVESKYRLECTQETLTTHPIPQTIFELVRAAYGHIFLVLSMSPARYNFFL